MKDGLNKPLIIIGGAGHGCVIKACVNDNRNRFHDFEWEVKGFCNDFDEEVDGCPVLGKLSDIPHLINEGYYFAWGIHLIGNTYKTARLFESIDIPDSRWATIVHKTAFVDSSVQLDPGVFIMFNAYVAPRTKIGKCAMIKSNTNIGHDVVIGAISHVAMGAIVVSFAELGYCSMVAVGATVLSYTHIGNYSLLGAGSLLTKDIPDGEIYVGIPAKFMRNITQSADKKIITGGVELFRLLFMQRADMKIC